ncbi:MAG: PQQ-binding-like beta-propeller repeat protein [Acidobacteriota bacterium]
MIRLSLSAKPWLPPIATTALLLAALVGTPLAASDDSGSSDSTDWTGFRNAGQALPESTDPPTDLATPTWTIELPGFGQSSPVVFDGVIFMTSVTGEQKETIWISAHDFADGRELWRKSWPASETMKSNEMVARAAPTPAVDSERLIALFGSGDLVAVDLEGKLLWRRNLSKEYGSFAGNHGVANSVALTDNAAVVLLARKTYSYLLAVDRGTGETLWKTDRAAGVSWTTPTVSPEGDEIVVSSNGSVEGYDPKNGERLWIVEDVKSNTAQSPVVTAEHVLVSGSEATANFAIKRGLRGVLDSSAIAWTSESTSNFGSPALSKDCAYWVNKAGVAQCIDPTTGRSRWKHRLPQSIWATPIVSQGRVYFFGDGGAIQILEDSASGAEVLASFELELDTQLTAAIAVDSTLLIRAGNQLRAYRR